MRNTVKGMEKLGPAAERHAHHHDRALLNSPTHRTTQLAHTNLHGSPSNNNNSNNSPFKAADPGRLSDSLALEMEVGQNQAQGAIGLGMGGSAIRGQPSPDRLAPYKDHNISNTTTNTNTSPNLKHNHNHNHGMLCV